MERCFSYYNRDPRIVLQINPPGKQYYGCTMNETAHSIPRKLLAGTDDDAFESVWRIGQRDDACKPSSHVASPVLCM